MKCRIAVLVVAILSLLGAPKVDSLELPPNPFEEQAPETLLDLQIGDADVSLFATGQWSTGVGLGLAYAFYRDENGNRIIGPNHTFPGLEPVPFFNHVGITLSLWVLQQYFLEAEVSDQLEQSTLILGYVGKPDGFVQSVLIGNSGIDMTAYPYLGFGDATGVVGQDSPGAVALFATDNSEHELMVRFSPSETETLTYTMGGVVTETSTDAAAYRRGRHFVLPDGNVTALVVYQESLDGPYSDGNGHRYRALDLNDEVVVSLAGGTLGFAEKPRTRIAVYYESGGLAVGDDSLGSAAFFGLTNGAPDAGAPIDFSFSAIADLLALFPGDPANAGTGAVENDFRVTVDGNDCLVIYDPSRYSPFEVPAYYDLAVGGGGGSIYAVETAAGREVSGTFTILPDSAGTGVRLGDPMLSPRAFVNRYPLLTTGEASLSSIYGPATTSPQPAPLIVARSISPADAIRLPSSFIPGSVVVQRNGIFETGFTVSDDGEVTLDPGMALSDVVDVTYRVRRSQGVGGLTVGLGNRIYATEALTLEVAAGLRWKPAQTRYSAVPDEYPGALTLSAGATYDTAARSNEADDDGGGQLHIDAGAAVRFSVSDTTGALRVAGMNRAAGRIDAAEYLVFPGSPPERDPDPLDVINGFSPTERGILHYVDFSTVDVLGNASLLPYNTPLGAQYELPYEEGGRAGPYPAVSADSDVSGSVFVVDYEMPVGRNWVAASIRVPGDEDDLSYVTGLQFSHRVMEEGDPIRAFVQMGAIGEDIDGDGVLDSGAGALPFTDTAAGYELSAGSLLGSLSTVSEDSNGNGLLDEESVDQVISREFSLGTEGSGWKTTSIELTDEERHLLASTRSVRLLIQRQNAPDSPSGVVVFSGVTLLGTSFGVEAPSSVGAVLREMEEPALIAESGGTPLSDLFPEVTTRFVDVGTTNRVASLRWSDLGGGQIRLWREIDPVRAGQYGSLRVYYRLSSISASGSMEVVAESPGGTTIASTTVALDSTSWQEAVVALPQGTPGTIARIVLLITEPAPGSHELVLDELSFYDPRSSFGAAAGAELNWQPGGAITIAGHEVVTDISLRQTLTARTDGFSQAGATEADAESVTQLGATVLGISGAYSAATSLDRTGTGLELSHEVELPLLANQITLRDAYVRAFGTLGERESHATEAEFAFAQVVDGGVSWSSRTDSSTASTWTGRLGGRVPSGTLSASGTLAFGETTPAVTLGSYPVSYFASFGRLLPATAGPIMARTTRVDTSADFGGEHVRARLTALLAGASMLASLSNDTTLNLGVELPLTIGETRLTVTGRRVTDMREARAPAPSPGAELGEIGQLLFDVPVWYANVPLYELVDPTLPGEFADATAGLGSATYRPAVSFALDRSIASRPLGLILPVSLDVEFARPLTRVLDSVADRHEIVSRATFAAPNLFGKLGVSPVFAWYDTDEYVTSVSVRLVRSQSWTTELDLDQRIRFLWQDGRSLVIRTATEGVFANGLTGSMSTEATYNHTSSADRLLTWERFAAVADAGAEYRHAEGLYLTGVYQPETQLTARFRHDTILAILDHGEIGLYAGAGIGVETVDSLVLFLTGFELGIHGRLKL